MKRFPRIFLMTVDNNFITIIEITQNKPENNYNNNDIDSAVDFRSCHWLQTLNIFEYYHSDTAASN